MARKSLGLDWTYGRRSGRYPITAPSAIQVGYNNARQCWATWIKPITMDPRTRSQDFDALCGIHYLEHNSFTSSSITHRFAMKDKSQPRVHEEYQYLDLIRRILKYGEHRPDR